MTNREFYNAIINGTVVLNAGKETETSYSAYGEDGLLITELREFAETAIAKLDKKNEAAKGKKGTKKPNPENDALKAEILGTFEPNTTYTAKVVGETVGVSTSKASAMLRQMVEAGDIVTLDLPKGKTREYQLPNN